MNEGPVQRVGFILQTTHLHGNAGIPQALDSTSGHLRVGVGCGHNHASWLACHEQVGTGRCLSNMAARLQCHIDCGVRQVCVIRELGQGVDLGMGFTVRGVPPFGQQGVVLDNNTSNHGVGPGGETAAPCQFQRPAHPHFVASGRAHESRFWQACNVFCMSDAMVIGPTPPGTGVIQLHFGATAS